MKVSDANKIRLLELSTPSEPRGTAPREAREAEDRVTTAAASQVAAATSNARTAAASGRAVRLEAIKDAIRQGTFRPDPQRIAERILGDAALTAALRSMLEH